MSDVVQAVIFSRIEDGHVQGPDSAQDDERCATVGTGHLYRWGGRASRLLWGAPVCEVIICRIVSVVMRQLACIKPKCRTFMNPGWRAMLEEAAQKLKDVEASGA